MVTATSPLADEDLVAVAGERETLEGFLEYHRKALSGKLRGLSEEDAQRRLVPSLTTMLGLVRHAAAVERNWFQHYLGGRPREVSLRWIYVHIIREHARHIGHADILREQIDGATGD